MFHSGSLLWHRSCPLRATLLLAHRAGIQPSRRSYLSGFGVQVRDAGNLLTRAGLNIPSVDVDEVTVHYSDPDDLVDHLRCTIQLLLPPK